MATDQRTGFRLPWSPDREADDPDFEPDVGDASTASETAADGEPAASVEVPAEAVAPESDLDAAAKVDTGGIDVAGEPEAASQPEPTAQPETADQAPGAESTKPAGTPSRAPGGSAKFLVDLSRAMQTAAEQARLEAQERFAVEAREFIESIHAGSASEADDLRRAADVEITEIRDWSKAEIARIREEAERRTTARKADLEEEIEDHAARIELRIERVQALVGQFETEMSEFFAALQAEEDPSRFAAMAERLPEGPSFEALDLDDLVATTTPEPTADGVGEPEPDPSPEPTDASGDSQFTTEAAIAIEADPDTTAISTDWATTPHVDARLEAMGLGADDAAAAEAEAIAELGAADEDSEIPTISEEGLASRLAGLLPPTESRLSVRQSKVVVVGLVSVASIAGFKRHLGRLSGVTAVGVTSGPDGEFVFNVSHDADAGLREAVPTIPGFAARVTGGDGDVIEVTAHDPEGDG